MTPSVDLKNFCKNYSYADIIETIMGHQDINWQALRELRADIVSNPLTFTPPRSTAPKYNNFLEAAAFFITSASTIQAYDKIITILRNIILDGHFVSLSSDVTINEQENKWRTFSADIINFLPASRDRDTNEPHQWFLALINTTLRSIAETISEDFDNDLTLQQYALDMARFCFAIKVYLEKKHCGATLTLRKNGITEALLTEDFLRILELPPQSLIASEGNEHKSNTCVVRDEMGPRIIRYFMEEAQLVCAKGSQASFEKTFKTPLLIKKLHRYINMFDEINTMSWNNAKNSFFQNMYYDLVPHASFNVMYLKNLFHTFREKGAVLNSIYDPTGGWGGTLLSAAISGFNTIIDNDRSPTVFEPKQGLVEFLLRQHYPSGSTPNIILMNKDITESPGPLLPFQVDIICNSPPFFKYEKYAVENGVNHDVNLGLKPIQNWIEVFCRPLVYHAAYYLRYGGIFAIQISNLSGAESIVQQFIWMANVTGLFDERPEKLHYSYMGKKPNYFYVFRKKLRIEFPITHVSSMQPESKKRDLDALQISCDCDTVGLFFRSENSNNTAITVNNRVSSQPRKRLQLSSLSGLQVVL